MYATAILGNDLTLAHGVAKYLQGFVGGETATPRQATGVVRLPRDMKSRDSSVLKSLMCRPLRGGIFALKIPKIASPILQFSDTILVSKSRSCTLIFSCLDLPLTDSYASLKRLTNT